MVPQIVRRVCLLTAALCCLLPAVIAGAKSQAPSTQPQPQGITVSPAIEQLTLHQNQSVATFPTTVTNHTGSTVLITVKARDFTASSDGKRLTFIGNTESSSKPHGLSNSLKMSPSQATLAPGANQKVLVAVSNATNLAPGGHYAALIYMARGVNQKQKNTVAIREAVSCLVFVNTYGGGTQTTTLSVPSMSGLVTSLPKNINVVLTNSGNTPTVPRGYVQIINSKSMLLAQNQLNVDSSMILPGSTRLFPISLVTVGDHAWYGVYHLKIFYRHDGQKNFNVYDKKLLLVSAQLIISACILVVVLIAVAVWLFKLRAKPKLKPESKPTVPKKSVRIEVK